MKKYLSLVLAFATVLTLSACGSTPSSVATYNEKEIPAGVYIYNQFLSLNQYANYFGDYKASGFLSNKLGEETVEQVINKDVDANMLNFAAVEEMFTEKGLTLDAQLVETTTAELKRSYETDKKVFDKIGIGFDSLNLVALNDLKAEQLFSTMYGVGGEKGITQEQVSTWYKENNTAIVGFEMSKLGDDGAALTGDALTVKEEFNKNYATRAKDEDFFTVMKEYYKTSSSAIEEGKTENDYLVRISKTQEMYYDPLLFADIFSAGKVVGNVYVVDSATSTFVYKYLDPMTEITVDETFLNDTSRAMNVEVFRADITAYGEKVTFTANEKATKTYSLKELLTRLP